MLRYLRKTVAGRTGEYYPYPARRSTTLAGTRSDPPFTASPPDPCCGQAIRSAHNFKPRGGERVRANNDSPLRKVGGRVGGHDFVRVWGRIIMRPTIAPSGVNPVPGSARLYGGQGDLGRPSEGIKTGPKVPSPEGGDTVVEVKKLGVSGVKRFAVLEDPKHDMYKLFHTGARDDHPVL